MKNKIQTDRIKLEVEKTEKNIMLNIRKRENEQFCMNKLDFELWYVRSETTVYVYPIDIRFTNSGVKCLLTIYDLFQQKLRTSI